jgi:hypothetical protein
MCDETVAGFHERPDHAHRLPDQAHVRVAVQTNATASDTERAEWTSASQAALLKIWDNPADEVFNELLTK